MRPEATAPASGAEAEPGHHYSPASVGGGGSRAAAKRLSSALSGAYHRTVLRDNAGVEHLQYPPADQPLDDLWSGSPADEGFWRSEPSLLVSRKASGLTRAQRRAGAATEGPPGPPPGVSGGPVRFFESTKSKARGRSP